MSELIENVSATETNQIVSAETTDDNSVIKYLKGLYPKDPKRHDRAALAHLRRGLGKQPKTTMEMFPYLGRFLPEKPNRNYERAIFIVAALFAYYPDAPGGIGNLGESVRRIKDDSGSIERRFVVLLNAAPEDLPYYLRQIIGLLKSKEIAVNWNQLFRDVQNWGNDDRLVQQRWAEKFWGNHSSDKNKNSKDKTGEQK